MKYLVLVGKCTNIPFIVGRNSPTTKNLLSSKLYRAVYEGSDLACILFKKGLDFKNELNEI